MIFTLIPSVTDTSVSFRHNHNHKHNSNSNYNRNHIHSHNTLVVPLPSSLSSSLSLSLSCRCMFVFLSLLLFLCFGFGFGFGFVSAQCNPQDPNSNGVPGGTPSTQALVMWVSSSTHTGALGGRVGANALCTSMQPASWTSAGITSQAMLSYSDQNLIEALPANFDIRNTKGQCIAADREDLFSGLLLGDLVFDQNRQSPGADINVITATNNQGYKAGLGLIPQNSPAEFYKGTDSPNKYCNDFTDDSAALTVSSLGKLKPGNDDIITQWIQYWTDTDAQGQCAQQNHIYCITSSPAPVHTVSQDPQFVGLQGQRFQVHGIPEEYFNLVSHPFFQLNSHFTYLATGICNYNDTACWSHPGTYVDELGLMLPGYEIGIFAGEHQHGLTVTVNGQTITQKTHTTTTTSSTSPFPFNAQFPLRIDNDTINSPHTAWLDPQPQPLSNSASASASASASRSVQSDSDSDIDSDNLSCTSSACWLLSSSISVSFLSHVHVVIDTPVATLDIYNADHFFNFALELRAPRLLLAGAPLDRVPPTPSRAHTHGHARAVAGSRAAGTGTGTGGVASAAISPATSPHPIFPMHGLVGQTWKNVKYPHGRLYAGEVDDYMLSDRRLFSTNFVYNEYQY